MGHRGWPRETIEYGYDDQSRVNLVSSKNSAGTILNQVKMTYDAWGNISKDFAGTSVADEDTYFTQGFQAIETRRNGSSNAYEQHVWNLRYIDAPVVRYRDANGHTTSTATGDGTLEETLYVTYDGNFNVTGLVQENQTFVERYVYTPYGDRTVLTASFGSRSSTSYDFQLGHQGLRIDTESGTYYNRGRQGYHPGIGAFSQRDPLGAGYQDGMNLYQFGISNPVMNVDPLGTDSFKCAPTGKKVFGEWKFLKLIPGDTLYASTGARGLTLGIQNVWAVFGRPYRELFTCCNCYDQGFERWGAIGIELGYVASQATHPNGTMDTIEVGGGTVSVKLPSYSAVGSRGLKIPLQIPFTTIGIKLPAAFVIGKLPKWKGYHGEGPTPWMIAQDSTIGTIAGKQYEVVSAVNCGSAPLFTPRAPAV